MCHDFKALEIIDIYTHKVEKEIRLTRNLLSLYRKPLLLIIGMQLGALIIYPFSRTRVKKNSFLNFTRLQLMG